MLVSLCGGVLVSLCGEVFVALGGGVLVALGGGVLILHREINTSRPCRGNGKHFGATNVLVMEDHLCLDVYLST